MSSPVTKPHARHADAPDDWALQNVRAQIQAAENAKAIADAEAADLSRRLIAGLGADPALATYADLLNQLHAALFEAGTRAILIRDLQHLEWQLHKERAKAREERG